MRYRYFVAAVIGTLVNCQQSLAPVTGSPDQAIPFVRERNDSTYSVRGIKTWYMKPDGLTDSFSRIVCEVVAPESIGSIDAYIGTTGPLPFSGSGRHYSGSIDISGFPAGDYELRLAANQSDTAFAAFAFKQSHAVYVAVSNDWDAPDNSWEGNDNATLLRQELLHERHPNLKITHFLGPYAFTSPSMTESRKSFLVQWHTSMATEFGDEIGLHIHAYCDFLTASAVTCIDSPSFGGIRDTENGYAVGLYNFGTGDLRQMIRCADSLFLAYGLQKPRSFRAGGWSAPPELFGVLADEGYLIDASECNWSRAEELTGLFGELYSWLKVRWPDASDTSQPYYPPFASSSSSSGSRLLEVPDNGVLADYLTSDEMIEVFEKNWNGSALQQPRHVSIGYHAQSLRPHLYDRIDSTLSRIDRYLAETGDGPVVYATMRELTKVWK